MPALHESRRATAPGPALTLVLGVVALALACRPAPARPDAAMSAAASAAIADTLRRMIADAYDLGRPGAVERMLALYPDSGRVVSAAAGVVVTSRDTLRAQLAGFWERIGQNMREPRWVWDTTFVDVLAPDAAVLTGVYRIPHRTPRGAPHEVGGAWTAVFARRGGRWVIVQEHLSSR